MESLVLPTWAPNLHPLVVHFPIVLIITALAADLVSAVFDRPAWLGPMAASLYLGGALMAAAAYWTGTAAAATVLLPGMAHPLVEDHRRWALATTALAGALGVARALLLARGVAWSRPRRLALAAAGLLVAVLVYQTAERGARLVYEQGVGVIGAP